jgi:hypothetical protein
VPCFCNPDAQGRWSDYRVSLFIIATRLTIERLVRLK